MEWKDSRIIPFGIKWAISKNIFYVQFLGLRQVDPLLSRNTFPMNDEPELVPITETKTHLFSIFGVFPFVCFSFLQTAPHKYQYIFPFFCENRQKLSISISI
jgi:hypothetical protein